MNSIVLFPILFFMLVGALDKILSEFGGSSKILNKIGLGRLGKGIEGSGKEFDEGLNAMGPLSLVMLGIIAIAPVLATVLSPIIVPIYELLGASPAMFAGTLLANDMGGYFLAQEMAIGSSGDINHSAALYSGLILGSMMGATLVYSIPVGIGIIKKKDIPFFSLGIMSGIVTIPLGCIAGGILAGFFEIAIVGSDNTAKFAWSLILINMFPVSIVSLILAFGLWYMPNSMIKGFAYFAKFIVILSTASLVIAVLQHFLGITIISGMDPIFSSEGDIAGVDIRAVEIIGSIALILLGAYPMVFIITRTLEKQLTSLGKLFKVDNNSVAGLLALLANNILMFKMMHKMEPRGKVICVAFAVSASFILGDHLAFTAAVKPDMIIPVLFGKIVGGISAILFAMFLIKHLLPLIIERSKLVEE